MVDLCARDKAAQRQLNYVDPLGSPRTGNVPTGGIRWIVSRLSVLPLADDGWFRADREKHILHQLVG
jgi:hypothetical protein